MAVILISILQKCNQFWQSMGYTGHFGPHDSLSFYAYQGNLLQLLPEKYHGQRSLAGYSPWGHRVRHN